MLMNPVSLLADTPGEWFLEVTCRCETDPPRSLSVRSLSGMQPERTLAQVAEQFVCVRRGKPTQRVVLVDNKTATLISDHYPE